MPQDPAGMPQTFGMDGVGSPAKQVDPSGMDEENLEKPSSDLPKNVIEQEKGETTGPKD